MTFVAEGPKVVGELLQAGIFDVLEIFALPTWVEEVYTASGNSIADHVQLITPVELDRISSLTTPHDVVAVFSQKKENELTHTAQGITLVLDEIKDPGNLGTLIRTAHWFGVDQIICSSGTVDQYNSKVVQSTMASLGKVPLYYINDLHDWLAAGRKKPLLAATLNGQPLPSCELKKDVCIMIGNESAGINPALLEIADMHLTIPQIGDAESLNAAVSGAIILYHFTSI